MAKKKFDLDDSFLDDLPAKPAVARKKQFDDPLGGMGETAVSRASGQSTDAKGRVRKTIFLPPDLIWEVEQAIKQEGYRSKMDFWHWLLAEGWNNYRDGQRPGLAEEVTRRDIDI